MAQDKTAALAKFKRTLAIIAVGGIVLVALVLLYLGLTGPLCTHMVVATVAGVLVSVLLGCGLFSLAFFSDQSGHDQDVSDSTDRSGPHH